MAHQGKFWQIPSRSETLSWSGPVAGSPRAVSENCPGWVSWSEVLDASGRDSWLGDYGVYVVVAIAWSSIACLLTLYMTSSDLFLSSHASPERSRTNGGDERTPLLGRKGSQPRSYSEFHRASHADVANQARSNAAIAPRKTLYFGSGSGISEIKCILSGFVIHGYLGAATLFAKPAVYLTLTYDKLTGSLCEPGLGVVYVGA